MNNNVRETIIIKGYNNIKELGEKFINENYQYFEANYKEEMLNDYIEMSKIFNEIYMQTQVDNTYIFTN